VDERHIHADKASGARDDRPGLKACLAWLKEGDTLVVWKLDRPALAAAPPVDHHRLPQRGIAFRSLTEAMDTTRRTASCCSRCSARWRS
jgi:DNA invertase Pin-like site-specific DNA recombinase